MNAQHDDSVAQHFKRQIERFERARSACARDLVANRSDQRAMNRAVAIQNEQLRLIAAHRAKDTNYYFPDV